MPFAHALIEAPDGTRYDRGDEVDLSKFEVIEEDGTDEAVDQVANLREGGALSDEEYDPAADAVGPPAVIEIEGVKYVQANDAAEGASDGERS